DREENRTFGGYAFHYWFDEKIDRFRRDFDWAKRLTYLAMRAIEYEFQQSTPLRTAILSAQSPDQLEDALLFLKQEQAGRTINRRRPQEGSGVGGRLRHLRGIGDKSEAAARESDES